MPHVLERHLPTGVPPPSGENPGQSTELQTTESSAQPGPPIPCEEVEVKSNLNQVISRSNGAMVVDPIRRNSRSQIDKDAMDAVAVATKRALENLKASPVPGITRPTPSQASFAGRQQREAEKVTISSTNPSSGAVEPSAKRSQSPRSEPATSAVGSHRIVTHTLETRSAFSAVLPSSGQFSRTCTVAEAGRRGDDEQRWNAAQAQTTGKVPWNANAFFQERLKLFKDPDSPEDLNPIAKTESPPSFDPAKSARSGVINDSGNGTANGGPCAAESTNRKVPTGWVASDALGLTSRPAGGKRSRHALGVLLSAVVPPGPRRVVR